MNAELDAAPAAKPDPHVLVALFREVNEHMRATESKHLQLALGYMSLLALALSILATFADHARGASTPSFIPVSWPISIAYGALSAVGCIVLFILDAYRGWKQHYRIVARSLVIELGAGDLALHVRWLANHPYIPQKLPFLERTVWGFPSPDNALTYFIGFATALAVSIFDYALWALVRPSELRTGLVVLTALGYLIFVTWSRLRVTKRVKRDCEDIARLELFPIPAPAQAPPVIPDVPDADVEKPGADAMQS